MKTSQFKQLIKESVREAIKEELKDILLEAIKSPKQIVQEHITSTPHQPAPTPSTPVDKKAAYMEIMSNMSRGQNELNFNSNQFVPRVTDTTSEGSSLPPGEVSLNQIMGLGLKI